MFTAAFPRQQGAALRHRHAIPAQDDVRNGDGPGFLRVVLDAHRDVHQDMHQEA